MTSNLNGQSDCNSAEPIFTFPNFTYGCVSDEVSQLLLCDIDTVFNISQLHLKTFELISEESHPFSQNIGVCNGGVFDNPFFIPFTTEDTFVKFEIQPILCDSFILGTNILTGIQSAVWADCDGSECLGGSIGCNLDDATQSTILSFDNLIPGNTYYLIVDGCGGSICQFQLKINDEERPDEGIVSYGCSFEGELNQWYSYNISDTSLLEQVILELKNYSLLDSFSVSIYNDCHGDNLIKTTCYENSDSLLTFFISKDQINNDSLYLKISSNTKSCHIFDLEVFENYIECSTSTISLSRPQNPSADPNGPYCPGEIIQLCYDLDFISSMVGEGNDCQYLQGIVPSITGSIDTSLIDFDSIFLGQGWTWLEGNNVDYNNTYSSYYIDNGALKYGESEISSGDLLPGGWWFTTPGGIGCENDGDPDNMWGLPSGCGSSVNISFCFELPLLVDENCEFSSLKTFSVDIFSFSDGSIGCYDNPTCGFDKPASFLGEIICESPINIDTDTLFIGHNEAFIIDFSSESIYDISVFSIENQNIDNQRDTFVNLNQNFTFSNRLFNTTDTIQTGEYIIRYESQTQCFNDSLIITYQIGPNPFIAFQIDGITNASCGENNGEIALSIAETHKINWSTGDTTTMIQNLSPGTYSATITTPLGITDSLSVTIEQEDQFFIQVLASSDSICQGSFAGFIEILEPDILPQNILWNSGDSTLILDQLEAGTYSLTLTDANGCVDSTTVMINDYPAVEISLISEAIECNSDEASIFIENLNAISYQSIQWSNSSVDTALIDVQPGNYSVTITDINGCGYSDNILTTNIDNTPPNLELMNLSYTLPPNGFVEEFSSFDFIQQVNDDCGGIVTIEPTIVILDCTDAGINKIPITAKDQSGNILVDTLEIEIIDDEEPFIFCASSFTFFGCAPIEYDLPFELDNCGIETLELVEGLGPGSVFPVGVTREKYMAYDYGGNVDSCFLEITVDYGIEYNFVALDASCSDTDDGVLFVSSNAINGPLNVEVTNYDGDLNALPPGEYYLELVDTTGCMLFDTAYVFGPEEINIEITDTLSFENFNGENGLINIEVSGGNPPYRFIWRRNGQVFSQSQNLNGLSEGIYQIEVQDAFGCMVDGPSFAYGMSTNLVDLEDIYLKIYPNPVVHTFEIETNLNSDINSNLIIYDTSGRMVYSSYTLDISHDISNFYDGVYYLTIQIGKDSFIKKIIKLD